MRRFRTKQTLKFANLNNFGVSFSMQAVLGGGQFRACTTGFSRG